MFLFGSSSLSLEMPRRFLVLSEPVIPPCWVEPVCAEWEFCWSELGLWCHVVTKRFCLQQHRPAALSGRRTQTAHALLAEKCRHGDPRPPQEAELELVGVHRCQRVSLRRQTGRRRRGRRPSGPRAADRKRYAITPEQLRVTERSETQLGAPRFIHTGLMWEKFWRTLVQLDGFIHPPQGNWTWMDGFIIRRVLFSKGQKTK